MFTGAITVKLIRIIKIIIPARSFDNKQIVCVCVGFRDTSISKFAVQVKIDNKLILFHFII